MMSLLRRRLHYNRRAFAESGGEADAREDRDGGAAALVQGQGRGAPAMLRLARQWFSPGRRQDQRHHLMVQ